MGFDVLEAEDGEHAKHLFKEYKGQIDLLLTDWIMPNLGGKNLIKSLRALNPQLKVIVISGYPLKDTPEAKELKIDAWIDKPPTTAQLKSTISKVLEDKNKNP